MTNAHLIDGHDYDMKLHPTHLISEEEMFDRPRVSRGDWLGNPANFRGACYCYGFRVVTWY